MKGKRILAALLAAVLLMVTVSAASSFSDIQDEATAVNADVLRLMGVVNGSGENRFSPDDILTRAQFCAMAIRVLGRENEVRGYESRTIFTDVASRHWARGYVNLAANIMVGDGSTRLIAGVGSGKFQPDDAISYAQAVTIVLRMLGYGDDKAGAVWPQGYLDLAAALDLGTAIGAAPAQPVSRAQAAQLFADLLSTVTASGQKYYASLGSVRENVILFSVNAGDGTLRTSEGTLTPALKDVLPTALELRKGTMVLNEKDEVVVFLPESTVVSKHITLKSDANATRLYAADGAVYPVDQKAFAVMDGVRVPYAPEALKAGMEAELIFEGGKLLCVVWNSPEEKFVPGEAQIVSGPVTAAELAALTGGAEHFRVERDGLQITLQDLKPYDAVTYNPAKKILTASELRLVCVYENASPNPASPTTITVLGHDFPVLRGAEETIGEYAVGEKVTLLLTADGAVAGMGPADLGGTVLGIAEASGVNVPLPNGENLRLSGTVEEKYLGKMVRVSSGKEGTLMLSTAYPGTGEAALDVSGMMLGQRKVTPNLRVYEGFDGSIANELSLLDLPKTGIPADKIVGWYENANGAVNMLVVEDLTGDGYTYGILRRTIVSGFAGGMSVENSAVSVKNGNGETTLIYTKTFEEDVFGGAAASSRLIAGGRAASNVVQLTAVSGVRRADFFQDGGQWYIRAGENVYPVADEVHGYIRATKKWFSQDPEAIRAYSDNMTVYIDPIGEKVRIIEV